MALARQHRLRGHRPFERLYRQGRRYQGTWLVLRLLRAEPALLPRADRIAPQFPAPPTSASGPPPVSGLEDGKRLEDLPPPPGWRCAVVVSAKVHKRAVRRNRLRRLLHEELRRHPLQPRRSVWLLFSLRPGSAEVEEALLLGECRQLLRQAGLRP